jgi:hypothetical protein
MPFVFQFVFVKSILRVSLTGKCLIMLQKLNMVHVNTNAPRLIVIGSDIHLSPCPTPAVNLTLGKDLFAIAVNNSGRVFAGYRRVMPAVLKALIILFARVLQFLAGPHVIFARGPFGLIRAIGFLPCIPNSVLQRFNIIAGRKQACDLKSLVSIIVLFGLEKGGPSHPKRPDHHLPLRLFVIATAVALGTVCHLVLS